MDGNGIEGAETHGKQSSDIILSEWQTCVEMADSVSHRRDVMNNLFVTLNLALIATAAVLFDVRAAVVAGAGIIVCVVWLFFIRSFRRLNKVKYDVIIEMEKYLPFQPFSEEWKKLQSEKRYVTQTALETVLLIVFIVLYVVAVVLALTLTL